MICRRTTRSVLVQDWKTLTCSENKCLPSYRPGAHSTHLLMSCIDSVKCPMKYAFKAAKKKKPPWKRTTTVKATEPSLCLCSSLRIEVLAMNAHSRMEGSRGYSLDLVVTSLIHLALYLYSEIQSQIHPFKSLGTLPHIRQTVMAARCWISTATGGQYRYPSQGVRGEKSFLKISRWNYFWMSFLSFTWSSPPCLCHMFSKLST